MPGFDWSELLARWNRDLIECPEIARRLPADAVKSGWLGYAPASEEQLRSAEGRLGMPLPPSYRAFLQVTNGWRTTGFFASPLFSAAEIEWLRVNHQQDFIDPWTDDGNPYPVTDEHYFVYGKEQRSEHVRLEYLQTALLLSDTPGDGVYLLNPTIVTADGEWEAWFLASWLPGARRERSFWDLMQREYQSFLALREDRAGAVMAPRSFHLALWDCQSLTSYAEAVDLAGIVRDVGLLPADGSWTKTDHPEPVRDLDTFVTSRHRELPLMDATTQVQRPTAVHRWGFPIIYPTTPRAFSTMSIQILHPTTWTVNIEVPTYCYKQTELSFSEYCETWGNLLERAGVALYERARPTLAIIAAVEDEVSGVPLLHRSISGGGLVVGWRTWYGPTCVEKFGRDWLLQLPDRTSESDDGGLFHQLGASAAHMAESESSAYSAVHAYLRKRNMRADWPPTQR